MKVFTERAIQIIKSIPSGKVASYGQIASMAGNPRAARQIARLLHSSSDKQDLPWFRVVNRDGKISLTGEGAIIQRGLLEAEGVELCIDGTIDFSKYGI